MNRPLFWTSTATASRTWFAITKAISATRRRIGAIHRSRGNFIRSRRRANGERFTHGLGVGDVNGDGRMDLLEKDGWWEQPPSLANDPVWTFHPFPFAPGGAAQMFAYDVNGDGLNDVITCLNPHGYGLVWWEQVRNGTNITFNQHVIMAQDEAGSRFGVHFSQPHSMALVDVDGDGLKDIVTGKRFWAHGRNGPDPESHGSPAVLYWFQLVRHANGQADFVPHLIDDDSGVGTQVVAGNIVQPAISRHRGGQQKRHIPLYARNQAVITFLRTANRRNCLQKSAQTRRRRRMR